MSHYDNQREEKFSTKKEQDTNMLKKINKLLTKIPHDKLLHLFVGLAIYSVIALLNPLIALIVVGMIALSKELHDHVSGKGTPETADFNYTLIMPIILFSLNIVTWITMSGQSAPANIWGVW